MFYFRRVFSFDVSIASSKKQKYLSNKLEEFCKDEGGIATVWAMFWLIICFSISGLAIDVTNAWKVKTILQSTADASALAGVYELQAHDEYDLPQSYGDMTTNARYLADKYATLNMRSDRYGDVLIPADIHIGYWNPVSLSFSDIINGNYWDGPASAVRVITRQSGTNETSAVGTFFLRFVGFNRFTVATEAVATIFIGRCAYDGLFSAGELNLTMGQEFYDEFCIHGELGIKAAQGNYVSPNSIVSAPSYDLCGQNDTKCVEDGSNIGFSLEDGFIEQTLFPEIYEDPDAFTGGGGNQTAGNIWASGKVDGYIASLLGEDGGAFEFAPPYAINGTGSDRSLKKLVPLIITGNTTLNDALKAKGYMDGFEKGITYEITCNGGKDVKLAPADDENWDKITQVVIIGRGCDFVFAPDIQYYDIVIATDSTSRSSFSSPEGVTIGYYDGCDTGIIPSGDGLIGYYPSGTYYGGAVTLLTQGSVHFASKFHSYDMEIFAANDVHLAGRPLKDSGGKTYAIVGDDLEPTGINVHVGTTITTGGDIHVSRSHQFNGCLGRVSSNLFDPQLSWRLVW